MSGRLFSFSLFPLSTCECVLVCVTRRAGQVGARVCVCVCVLCMCVRHTPDLMEFHSSPLSVFSTQGCHNFIHSFSCAVACWQCSFHIPTTITQRRHFKTLSTRVLNTQTHSTAHLGQGAEQGKLLLSRHHRRTANRSGVHHKYTPHHSFPGHTFICIVAYYHQVVDCRTQTAPNGTFSKEKQRQKVELHLVVSLHFQTKRLLLVVRGRECVCALELVSLFTPSRNVRLVQRCGAKCLMTV